MGEISTRMISASSYSKTASSISMDSGDAAAWVAGSDMLELGDISQESQFLSGDRCSQLKKASLSSQLLGFVQMAATSSFHD